ncbi:MAG: (Dimethylallyl)adenosine tRNA methylthiotransferase MiaB, partial [Candidatus Magasanikbacteria bacterium GW2011_GWC2_41_17]
MNKSDSERIVGLLISLGGVEVKEPDEADLVMLNTCSVRQSAENRLFGQVRNLTLLKKNKPDLIIGITGCLPGRDKDGALRHQLAGVDLFFPITDLPKLADKLIDFGLVKAGARNSAINYWDIAPRFRNNYQVMVPIQFGCDNYCTYCIVPFARGRETNRPVADILREVRDLAGRGFLEIQLLGQVVNNYKAPDAEDFSFADLLLEINQINGINRIQF